MPSAGNGSVAEPSIQFELVHAVRGRTRMRVTPPELADELALAVERLLRDQPGIRQVRGNVDSGSVVITYDPDVLELERLFAVEPVPSGASAWTFIRDPRAGAQAVLAGGAGLVADVRGAVEALWTAGRSQISAVISRWRASSVVALSTTLLQWPFPPGPSDRDGSSRR
jgi:hypothetical protein